MVISPLFIKNFDNNHCLQASLLMCLNSVGNSITFSEIDKLTNYNQQYWTWAIFGAKALQDKMPGIQMISGLDYRKIATDGKEYLKKTWGENSRLYIDQAAHSSPDFLDVKLAAKEFFKNGGKYKHITQKPTEKEISNLLKKYLIIAWINWNVIYAPNNRDVKGHFVVIFAEKDDSFIIHDSGLGPKPGKKITKSQLLSAGCRELLLIPKGVSPIGTIISRTDPCYCGSGKEFKLCHMKILIKEGKTTFQ